MKRFLPLLLILPLLLWVACEDEDTSTPEIEPTEDCAGVLGGDNICGCTDSNSSNYDSEATFDDGSCQYIFFNIYGGSEDDNGNSVQQTTDGGYIVLGFTGCWDNCDVWLIKTDIYGNEEWNQTYGGNGSDRGESVQQTSDGGYIIFATTNSFSGNGLWLIKTDSNGNEEWNQTFAGTEANSVQQTSDGGYIITGAITIDTYTVLLIKADSQGNEEWHKTFDYTEIGGDNGLSVKQTTDGGYIITGYTSADYPYSDALLIKTDINGNEEWHQTYGGNGYDRGESVQQTSDGGYIIFGELSDSPVLFKTDSQGQEQWRKILEGSRAWSGQQTIDGGYIVTGSAGTAIGAFLVKTDSNGNEVWRKIFGGLGVNGDWGYSVQQTSDGGYVITGGTTSFGDGYKSDIWLIKTDSEGNTTDNP